MSEKQAHPLNVAGDFYIVNQCCITCDLPRTLAPDMFRYTDNKDHCFVYKQPETPDQLERMIKAMEAAEVRCVRCRTKNQSLLRTLRIRGLELECDTMDPKPATLNLRSLLGHAGALASVAVRSFAGTLFLFVVAGVLLGALSYYCLRDNRPWPALMAAVAVIESVALGIFLACKRALLLALAAGVERAQLGRAALGVCIDGLLSVSPEDPHGDRGRAVAITAERLPLAQAEKLLSQSVSALTRGSVSGSVMTRWFWRLLNKLLLRLVQSCTLAKFREQDAEAGGVDLIKVKYELGPSIDSLLIRKLTRGLTLWTFALYLALLVLVSAQIYLVHWKVYAPWKSSQNQQYSLPETHNTFTSR